VARLDIKVPFGKTVKLWRDKLGVSQEKLAERAGLHRTYISDIERGARNVSLESIQKLAEALGVSMATLFANSGEEPAVSVPVKHLASNELVDILLVEDNKDDTTMALEALHHANITNRIQVVTDGQDALDFLFCEGKYSRRHPGDQPQMILLDLNLPKISGMEVLRRIKADPRTQGISVVVLTASSRDKDIQACMRLGANTYIVKPVDFQNLSQVTPQLSLRWALLKAPVRAQA